MDTTERGPAALQKQKDAIVQETEDLAFANYNAFIQTATCSADIFKDVRPLHKRDRALLLCATAIASTMQRLC